MSDKHRHRGEWNETEHKYLCRDCGVEICTDCGSRPKHEDHDSYCRPCGTKGGDRHSFESLVDHDKLRAKLGKELADAVIRECRVDGY